MDDDRWCEPHAERMSRWTTRAQWMMPDEMRQQERMQDETRSSQKWRENAGSRWMRGEKRMTQVALRKVARPRTGYSVGAEENVRTDYLPPS
jgi:hypothetical protein